MTHIDVAGHSGCSIEVVRGEGGRLMVRKSTDDARYAPRLHAQGRKQTEALGRVWRHIRVPQVHRLTCTDSQAVIDMDYVHSRNFIDFFEEAGPVQIDSFISSFIEWIDSQVEGCAAGSLPREVLTDKAASVARNCAGNGVLPARALDALPRCLDVFDRLPATLALPLGMCHGDLTFSNILFSGDDYFLIDFLDSFVESPLIDIVKLRQDTRHGWSRLMYRRRYDSTRLDIVSAHLDARLDGHFSGYSWYRDFYPAFQLLNFMRIMPYAKEETVGEYLAETVLSLLDSQP